MVGAVTIGKIMPQQILRMVNLDLLLSQIRQGIERVTSPLTQETSTPLPSGAGQAAFA